MAEIHDIIEGLNDRIKWLEKAVLVLIKFNEGDASYDDMALVLKDSSASVREQTERAINEMFVAAQRERAQRVRQRMEQAQ